MDAIKKLIYARSINEISFLNIIKLNNDINYTKGRDNRRSAARTIWSHDGPRYGS